MTHHNPQPDPAPFDLMVKGVLYATPRVMTLLGTGLLTWFLYEAIL